MLSNLHHTYPLCPAPLVSDLRSGAPGAKGSNWPQSDDYDDYANAGQQLPLALTATAALQNRNQRKPKGKGKGKGKGKSKGQGKGKAGQLAILPAMSREIGSSAGLYWESGVDGTVHGDPSKNDHCNLPGVGRIAVADLNNEFGIGVCRASIMSKLFGNLRFTACQHSGHPAHSDCRSGAHEFPADYRARVRSLVIRD